MPPWSPSVRGTHEIPGAHAVRQADRREHAVTARHNHALRTPDIVGGSYRDVGEHSLALEQVIFVAVAKVTRHRRIQSDAVLPLFVNQVLTSRKAIFVPTRGSRPQCSEMPQLQLDFMPIKF